MSAEPEARPAVPSRMLLRTISVALTLALAAWIFWPFSEDEAASLETADLPSTTDEASLRTAAGGVLEAPGLRGRTPGKGVIVDEAGPTEVEKAQAARFRPIPFEARFVEAETGRGLSVAWRPYDTRDLSDNPEEEERAVLTDGEEPEPEKADVASVGTEARPFARSSPQPLMPDRGHGGAYGVVLDEEALRRRVAWDEATWDVAISKYATSVEAVYPLRAEARVHVRGVEHDGSPVEGIHVEGFKVAGRYSARAVRSTPDRDGMLVFGLPFFRHQPLEVLVRRPPEPDPREDEREVEEICYLEVEEVEAEGGFDGDRFERATIGKGRFHRRPDVLVRIEARFPEDAAGGLWWGSELPFEESFGYAEAKVSPVEKAPLRVSVVRRNGHPAVGATVRCYHQAETTDAEGVALFEAMQVGERHVYLDEPGLVATSKSVVVSSGSTTRVTLQEAEGGSLRVRVLAPDGEPAPFAIVRLAPNAGWIDLDQGVQRIDPFTDVRGQRTLEHVPAGQWPVAASWGGLVQHVEAKVLEGGVATVTIKLPQPETDEEK